MADREYSHSSTITLNYLTAIAAIAVALVVSYYFSIQFSNNITGFFRIGSEFTQSPFLDLSKALVFEGEIGHDGSQFLTVAFDPLLQHAGTIEALDVPSYRYRRILFPLLGYVLSGGQHILIPYALVAINCIAAIVLVRITALFVHRHQPQRSAWSALFVLCIPGVWFCLILSTAGLLATCLAIAALYYYRHKPRLAAMLVASACLARETSVLYWLALVTASLLDRDRAQLKHLVTTIAIPSVWIAYTSLRPDLQRDAELAVNNNFSWPLEGTIRKVQGLLATPAEAKTLYECLSFGLLLAVFVLLFWIYLNHRKRLAPLRGAFAASLLGALLFVMCSHVVLG